jgi:hypothetical protein
VSCDGKADFIAPSKEILTQSARQNIVAIVAKERVSARAPQESVDTVLATQCIRAVISN